MQQSWTLILDMLVALSGALVLGLLCERIGINSIVGYLIAGVAVGPGALQLVDRTDAVQVIAEIGVALLLFTIGLEFSWRRLLRLGRVAVVGGAFSIIALIAAGTAISMALGVDVRAAVALGMMLSLGSTAIVLRVLKSNNGLDALYGRYALGILLVQDVAVVPLVLAVSFLSDSNADVIGGLGAALWAAVALVLALVLFVSLVVPRLLDERVVARNRELPIILAITTCIGATWAAHSLSLSPALGAFFAGMLLAESKFADQMRADVFPLKTLFLTVFFVSVGLLADLAWMISHVHWVLIAAAGVIAVKTSITFLAMRPFKPAIVESLATALTISQVGEFSFVLASVSRSGGLLSDTVFQLILSTTLVTLIVTPFLASNSSKVARKLAKRLFPARKLAQSERDATRADPVSGHVVIVGFGESGQAACATLRETGTFIVAIDVSPQMVRIAEQRGHRAILGDATQLPILETAKVETARAVLVAVPDYSVSRTIIGQCKSIAPQVPLAVRARYHAFADELDVSGADLVVDEEQTVGRLLGLFALDPAEEALDDAHSLR